MAMRILRTVFAAAVIAAGGSLLFTARNGVESDLLALAGSPSGGLMAASSAMSSIGRFLVKADSEDSARARLESLGLSELLRPSGQAAGLPEALKAIAPYAPGFLSPPTKALLEDGKYAAVRDAAVARLFSPMPPVLPLDADPFLLFTDYVMETGGRNGEWVAVNVRLSPAQASRALKAVKGCGDVRCAGAPFHAAMASERSKREVNALSVISLVCVAVFGWALTRSFRFAPALLCILFASFCVATAMLFAVFGRPHVVTFVFGTTLIGLSVDYVYHSLVAQGSIAKPLAISFFSTAACFVPLMLSDVGAMRQMALFTVAGLATAYVAANLFLRPAGIGGPGRVHGSPECRGKAHSRGRAFAGLAVVASMALLPHAVGIVGVRCGFIRESGPVDISRFYRPGKYMAEGERIASGMAGGVGFIPGGGEQRENARLVAKLYEAEGAGYCAMTGLPKSLVRPPDASSVFDPKGAIETLFGQWLSETNRLLWLSLALLSVTLLFVFGKGCIDFVIPIAAAYLATDGLLRCMGESSNFFARICFFLFVGLGIDYSVFRWHGADGRTASAIRYSFLTSLVGFGLLGFTDFAVTRLMGITLAFGLAASYFASKMCAGLSGAMFRSGGRGGAGWRSPAMADGCAGGASSGAQAWHEQREQCASRFWMRFMWQSYACFGKAFQKLIFLFAMPVIFLCARPARVALRRFYAVLSEHTGRRVRPTPWRLFRHILGFAWGLMDKTDASTLKKSLPRMSVRDDEGWRAFREVIDSGKGAFVLCSHLGVIGVLPALPETLSRRQRRKASECDEALPMRVPKVHAFQQMGHDAVFMDVFMRHFDRSRIELHAVEDIGVETAVSMQEAIARGELVIMAGDRTSAGSRSVLRHRFLGRECLWPKGAFRFAELMEAPIFGITCVRTGWNGYEVHVARLGCPSSARNPGCTAALLDGYIGFLEAEVKAHPEQWYQFYDFFEDGAHK